LITLVGRVTARPPGNIIDARLVKKHWLKRSDVESPKIWWGPKNLGGGQNA